MSEDNYTQFSSLLRAGAGNKCAIPRKAAFGLGHHLTCTHSCLIWSCSFTVSPSVSVLNNAHVKLSEVRLSRRSLYLIHLAPWAKTPIKQTDHETS